MKNYTKCDDSRVTLHSTLKAQGTKKFARMKNWHGILHNINWIMFYSLPDIALDPLKRGVSSAKTRGA